MRAPAVSALLPCGLTGGAAGIDFEVCHQEMFEAAHAMMANIPQQAPSCWIATIFCPSAVMYVQQASQQVFLTHSCISWFLAGFHPRVFLLEQGDPRF
ncbi:hypothetical protein AB838_17575 [Rhodobacteraceae bacterium (ex Bugula neritina AB1)]|nr:hypothetical protein AB838_17575 [Rhodobacteraceae bacterium (ex Bugula neritina AB1)]